MIGEEYFRKRKSDREEDDSNEEDIFKRSKKIGRSPAKNQRKLEDNLETLMEMMRKMGEKINEMAAEIKETREEQKEYRKEMKDLIMENQNIKEENKKMKDIIRDMDTRLERMENEKRKNNVVVQGFKADTHNPEELKNNIAEFMEKELSIRVEIESATKMAEKTCLVRFKSYSDKKKVMMNKNKLRQKTEERFFINDDLSRKDRDIQKHIRIKAKEARELGNVTKIGYRKLFIGSEEWRWDNEEEKLKINAKKPTKN